jgi:hypothetical protein
MSESWIHRFNVIEIQRNSILWLDFHEISKNIWGLVLTDFYGRTAQMDWTVGHLELWWIMRYLSSTTSLKNCSIFLWTPIYIWLHYFAMVNEWCPSIYIGWEGLKTWWECPYSSLSIPLPSNNSSIMAQPTTFLFQIWWYSMSVHNEFTNWYELDNRG